MSLGFSITVYSQLNAIIMIFLQILRLMEFEGDDSQSYEESQAKVDGRPSSMSYKQLLIHYGVAAGVNPKCENHATYASGKTKPAGVPEHRGH